MCKVIYIGTDIKLEESHYIPNKKSICITEVSETILGKNKFGTEHIYRIDTRDGCGCDFYDDYISDEVAHETLEYFKQTGKVPAKYKEIFSYEDTLELLQVTIDSQIQSRQDTEKLFSLIRLGCKNGGMVVFLGTWTNYEDNDIHEVIEMNPYADRIRIDFGKFWNQNIKIVFRNK